MEKEKNKILFEKLEKCISEVFLQEYSTSNPLISEWKGIEIVYFQEHLLKKVKANVSEKWFYTYFKTAFNKLPRIDMLNLLSQYCGYKSWADFCDKNKDEVLHLKSENINFTNRESKKPQTKNNKNFYKTKLIQRGFIGLVLSCILILSYILYKKNTEYNLYFYDADKKTLIKSSLDIKPILGSKADIIQNEKGFYTLENTTDSVIIFTVNNNFYKLDTIRINLNLSNGKEKVILEPDIYANLLFYYSKSYTKNIDENRKKLNYLIDDKALIYQSFDNDEFGYEVYTKQQYIDFLSIPTNSLKNLVILKSRTKNNKIIELRFKIKSDEK